MISVTFTSDVENIVATEHLYQWDNGQKLSISGVGTTADIHFANKKSEKALVVTPTVTSGAMEAPIPNSLLAEPYPIIAYVYVPSDNGSKTIKSVTINVEARKQPSDFVLTEDEGITTLETISQRANEMIQNATNQVNTAIANMQTDYGNFKTTIQSELADMVANTTIPNADMVDGHHASDFALKTDIPSTLPANGGNADTVGNLPASNFLGSSTNFNYHYINGAGTLAISIAKEEDHMFAFNFTDTPTAYGFLDVSSFDGEGFSPAPFGLVRQVWTDWGNPAERFVRIYKATSETDGVWTDWSRCNAATANTANTAGTLATTPTNVCLRNISFGTAEPQVTDSSAEGYVAEGALYGQYV